MKRQTMSNEKERHAAQLAFIERGAEIEVGEAAEAPIPIAALVAVTGSEPWVVETLSGGLTARVYRLRAGGRDWTLKRSRAEILVQNVDGQTSFLNEVQRRSEFAALRADPAVAPRFASIVDTQYASWRKGIILSPWIEGHPVADWGEGLLQRFFDQLTELLLAGFFEWDFCPGNVLGDGRRITLFDFGYMYRFDPLTEFNSNGLADPLFHGAERFETRNYFAFLLRLEQSVGRDAALTAFRSEKEIAAAAYLRLERELSRRGAAAEVLQWLTAFLRRWEQALVGDLNALYLAEGWRSHLLDLNDDLHGKTCTPATLARADWLLDAIGRHYGDLKTLGAFFWEDVGATARELTHRLEKKREQARRHQVNPSAA